MKRKYENAALFCRWCGSQIYEGIPEGRKRTFAHLHNLRESCSVGALLARNRSPRHIAFPVNDRIVTKRKTTPFERDSGSGDS